MLGTVVGDIVGSIYEFDNIKTKSFPLFSDKCFFTDDTVITVAVSEAIKKGAKPDDFIDEMKAWGRRYPYLSYSVRFGSWLRSDTREPYNSWGNGSAMRAGPCAWAVSLDIPFDEGLRKVADLAARSAAVTHNHPEGIKGAQAAALGVYFMRHGAKNGNIDTCKTLFRDYITEHFGYDLNRTLDEIRPVYDFNESCQQTVPEAIIAFLESTDFEDAIRNAVSIGGDSDTIGAITGAIAEAAYGIPPAIREKALTYLDEPLRAALSRPSL